MTIEKIEQEGQKFTVYFKPSWLGRFFGYKPFSKRFKTNYNTYEYGGGNVYWDEDGRLLGNGNWIGEAIDRFQFRKKFNAP